MVDSRLSRRSEKQSKKQLYGSVIGIFAIIFIALNFGPFLLAASGSAIDSITGKNREANNIISDAELQPPQLDPISDATSEPEITVTGRSYYPKGSVELYVNGSKRATEKIDDSLDFEFSDIKLATGTNNFKFRMIQGDKKSEFSDEYEVVYLKDAPKLEVEAPSDGSTFTKGDQEITVRGKTDTENTITVSGFTSIVDSEGNFSYLLKLNDGENKIKIVAENLAGKSTEKEITVSYSQ